MKITIKFDLDQNVHSTNELTEASKYLKLLSQHIEQNIDKINWIESLIQINRFILKKKEILDIINLKIKSFKRKKQIWENGAENILDIKKTDIYISMERKLKLRMMILKNGRIKLNCSRTKNIYCSRI